MNKSKATTSRPPHLLSECLSLRVQLAYVLFIVTILPLSLFAQAFKQIIQTPTGQQQFLIQQYGIAEGLSNQEVTTILQDRQGFIWIGTRDGLNKFDGYEFIIYKHQPGNQQSISNNEINTLYEDRNGKLWIGTNGGLNSFDAKTESFTCYRYEADKANSISDNYIRAILEDKDGMLWLGGQQGLNRFNRSSGSFELFQHQASQIQDRRDGSPQEISALGESKDGHLIIGYWGMGTMRFDKKTKQFSRIFLGESGGLHHWVNLITTDSNGELWISSTGEVYKYESNKERQIRIALPFEDGKQSPFAFVPTRSGQFLSGSHKEGLFILDEHFQILQQFKPNRTRDKTPSDDNWIQVSYEDRAGDIWIGTRSAGIFHMNKNGNQFTNLIIRPDTLPNRPDLYITSIIEVEKNQLWLSTRRHGVRVFDKATHQFSALPHAINFPTGLNHKEIVSLYPDSRGNIWIGTWGRGVNIYSPESGSFDYFLNDYDDPFSLADAFVNCFLETREGEMWMGTTHGISIFPDQQAIQRKKAKPYLYSATDTGKLNHPWITAMTQTQKGEVWVGTKDGLHLLNRDNDRFIRYLHDPGDRQSLISNNILSLYEDRNENLWIGTGSGLNKWNPESKIFEWITKNDGLANDHILQVGEDKNGFIWLSTPTGISKLNPKTKLIKNYGSKDGLFNFDPFLISKHTGLFYAGGDHGLSYFHPDSIQDNSFVPPVVISAFKKYNTQTEQISAEEFKGMGALEELKLSYLDKVITFGLTALNYRNTERNQYAYQLEGFNQSWISNGTKREISFTNLDPGNYTLRVIGSNNHGVWNKEGAALKISIAPPWWQTSKAWLLYFLLVTSLMYLVYKILLRRQELQHQLQLEKSEATRLKELDGFKTRLTTNLTHEFRTPLTVILGMVGQMKNEPQKYLNEGTRLIEANGKSLLRLINQLLDLSKLEDRSFQLNLKQRDIVPYLKYITESFQTYANGKNLSLRFFSTLESLVMDYDAEQIKQVMTNLISNAVKFTPSGGEVIIRILRLHSGETSSNTPQLQIEVKDTGIGISEKDLPNIFDRFYQVDGSATREGEGTGIGLAHTQELVKLMGGSIHVNSLLEKGTSFLISLPIHNEAALAKVAPERNGFFNWQPNESRIDLLGNTKNENGSKGSLPDLLIIEDNPDVVIYLKSCLSANYNLDIAYNGRIGIEKALQHIPDIIISDVMMPEKDGYEVCDHLKNDERTSHIPIILLTAKADNKSKITGLKRGADAYLSKPFDKEELLIRLQNLIRTRKKMQSKFAIAIEQAEEAIVELSQDEIIEDQFIQKVKLIIEENIADENFALPQLCEQLKMSRSQLFRKMKALINTSPSQLIRSCRMKEAKQLLINGKYNVSEVAWKVGFKDASHFTKVYKEEYGEPPSNALKGIGK